MTDERLLRVLCVDDNEMLAAAIVKRIGMEPDLRSVGTITDGSRAGAVIRQLRPDIVLMDIDMPGVDAFKLTSTLANEIPEVRTVMFSGHVDARYIDSALDSGAWAYLSKNEDVDHLMECIRSVGSGNIVFSREVLAVQRASR